MRRWSRRISPLPRLGGYEAEDFEACVDDRRDPKAWRRDGADGWTRLSGGLESPGAEAIEAARLPLLEPWSDYRLTPIGEAGTPDDDYLLMGRGYIDAHDYGAVEPKPDGGPASGRLPPFEAPEGSADALLQTLHHAGHQTGDRLRRRGGLPPVERKHTIDFPARQARLRALCDEIRGSNGDGYDCVVPVSGGKDVSIRPI